MCPFEVSIKLKEWKRFVRLTQLGGEVAALMTASTVSKTLKG